MLLDEIEKAHRDVFNTLLQVMDDGRLTDGQGRTVDFKNTVLIMTSNIPMPEGLSDTQARNALLENFKPEFVNRLDDVVRFDPLSREQLSEIVELQVARVLARLAERGVTVTLTDEAKQLLGNMGYDPAYGARPLRRVIQKQLTDRLALALLRGEIRDGDTVRVDAVEGELAIEKAERAGARGCLAASVTPISPESLAAARVIPASTDIAWKRSGPAATMAQSGPVRTLTGIHRGAAARQDDPRLTRPEEGSDVHTHCPARSIGAATGAALMVGSP